MIKCPSWYLGKGNAWTLAEVLMIKCSSWHLGKGNTWTLAEAFLLYFYWKCWLSYSYLVQYEHTMLLELIKKGHAEPEKKIGSGIRTFQVRKHPTWKSRCFFLVREDGFVDDFSFRKCVDCILPLPENMKLHNKNNNGNKKFRGHHRGSQARGRGGRGRQGGSRT